MFVAALFTGSRKWKKTKFLSADVWIRESVGCLGNGILHATKRNGISFKWCWGEEWSVHAHCGMDELYAG